MKISLIVSMTSASLQVLGDCKNYKVFDGKKSSEKK